MVVSGWFQTSSQSHMLGLKPASHKAQLCELGCALIDS